MKLFMILVVFYVLHCVVTEAETTGDDETEVEAVETTTKKRKLCKTTCEKGNVCSEDITDEGRCRNKYDVMSDNGCVSAITCVPGGKCGKNEDVKVDCEREARCNRTEEAAEVCGVRCGCEWGFVRDDSGDCISEKQCAGCKEHESPVFTGDYGGGYDERRCESGLVYTKAPNQWKCECEVGYALGEEGECIPIPDCPNIFDGPNLGRSCQEGSENSPTRHYYYDGERGECLAFGYRGCGGNANNFGFFSTCQSVFSGKVRKEIYQNEVTCPNGKQVETQAVYDNGAKHWTVFGRSCEDNFCSKDDVCLTMELDGKTYAYCCQDAQVEE